MKQLRKLLSLYVVLPVLVVAVAAGVNCGNGISPQVAEEMAQDGETTTSSPLDPAIPVLQSDLEITRLELSDYGSKLIRGSTFSISVEVANKGQAASGEYTVEIWRQLDLATFAGFCSIDDDDHESFGIKTLMDSYKMGSLAPGKTYTIEKEDALLDFRAWYTISAEITPIGWQESNNRHHVESLDIEADW